MAAAVAPLHPRRPAGARAARSAATGTRSGASWARASRASTSAIRSSARSSCGERPGSGWSSARRMSLGGGVVIWGRAMAERREQRPAFYALRPGGWRDLVTLLHPPYTAWHLSYVALGAAAAPAAPRRLGSARRSAPSSSRSGSRPRAGRAATAARSARGSPTGRWSSSRRSALAGAVAIGDRRAVRRLGRRSLPFVLAGAFLVLAYNLELFGGRFHTDFWFAAAWGAFPALTGCWVERARHPLVGEAVAGAGVAAGLLRAERGAAAALDAGARAAAATVSVSGKQALGDGTERELTSASARRAARRRTADPVGVGRAPRGGGGRDPALTGQSGNSKWVIARRAS